VVVKNGGGEECGVMVAMTAVKSGGEVRTSMIGGR
jgi:hypothetical protein